MLEERSERRGMGGGTKTSTGAESRGVLFPKDLGELITNFVNDNWPQDKYPNIKVGQVLTGLMYSGVQNEDAVEIVNKYITENAPNSNVNKAASLVEKLTDEEKQALIKRLGL